MLQMGFSFSSHHIPGLHHGERTKVLRDGMPFPVHLTEPEKVGGWFGFVDFTKCCTFFFFKSSVALLWFVCFFVGFGLLWFVCFYGFGLVCFVCFVCFFVGLVWLCFWFGLLWFVWLRFGYVWGGCFFQRVICCETRH